MPPTLEAESTLTDRYQTTVPEAVRRVLKLSRRDKLRYAVSSDGSVILTRVAPEEADPALGAFLEFLSQDMARHPARLRAIPAELAARARAAVEGVSVDLDAPLSETDE